WISSARCGQSELSVRSAHPVEILNLLAAAFFLIELVIGAGCGDGSETGRFDARTPVDAPADSSASDSRLPGDAGSTETRTDSSSDASVAGAWAKSYRGVADMTLSAMVPIHDGFVVAGSLDVDPTAVDNRDGFVMALAIDGSVRWKKTYGEGLAERF